MNSETLDEKKEKAVWIARSLFERCKTAGSTANLSFRHGDTIYISGSGTCFGTLNKTDFCAVRLDGTHIGGCRPSKESPLHLMLYQKSNDIQAVIHTHSFYSVLWSCMEHKNIQDCIPAYTPYLRMKLGTVGLVPYAAPGSDELFEAFKSRINASDGYLLQNHGPIVGGKTLMDAFFALEELEESARIAWELRGTQANQIN